MITTHSNNFLKKPHLYFKKKINKTNIFYHVTPYDEEREREREGERERAMRM